MERLKGYSTGVYSSMQIFYEKKKKGFSDAYYVGYSLYARYTPLIKEVLHIVGVSCFDY